jgi:hypothetical protein
VSVVCSNISRPSVPFSPLEPVRRSNEIKLNVDFPNYLKSTNGFRFKDEFSEESAGLGGANFIAINPDSYVSQLNLHIINE